MRPSVHGNALFSSANPSRVRTKSDVVCQVNQCTYFTAGSDAAWALAVAVFLLVGEVATSLIHTIDNNCTTELHSSQTKTHPGTASATSKMTPVRSYDFDLSRPSGKQTQQQLV